MSQFARVLPMSDWERLSRRELGPDFPGVQRADRWASVVLGEILAQSENETAVGAIPLAIAGSCFSTAVARTNLLHGSYEAMFMCINRLEQLELDRRFQKRAISLAQLSPAWDTLNSPVNDEFSAQDAAIFVAEFAAQEANSSKQIKIPYLSDFKGLFSDSIEDRVIAFQRLSASLLAFKNSKEERGHMDVLVAAAAFLVGRGTSHSFLVGRAGREFATAYIWFGVIAALAGPKAWDTNWFRTAKGIERTLRAPFDWTDAPSADVSWLEYSWMSKAFDNNTVFNEIPKMAHRGITIEVMPGAGCHFRFSDSRMTANDIEQSQPTLPSPREQELEKILSQFLSLAAKTKQIIGNTQVSSASPSSPKLQSDESLSLFASDETKKIVKTPRVIRRTKRL
ncbi:hypothetical protein [Herbaspirillum huttiense]|uniref:hypothetical protein n=1 Tax=Herbaspirillum huttiense TaxID=863372 RepID=UPI002176BE03|nr:hypothetical protein [Herbaspirillum huttiense]UWE15239.1 hypothetical protein NY669_19385 [Herbaspirillum huttiense]